MFREHDFNSRWWGARVGISTEFEALELTESALAEAAAGFDWVEVRVPEKLIPIGWVRPPNRLSHVDIQLSYRVSLRDIPRPPENIEIVASVDLPIDQGDLDLFRTERYARLPEMNQRRLQSRYEMWATELSQASPESCATVLSNGIPVGYVFGSVADRTSHFTLAAGSRTKAAPGLVVYLGAAAFFRGLGARSMNSSLSACNVASLNAHVALGCIFREATGVWIWTASSAATPDGVL